MTSASTSSYAGFGNEPSPPASATGVAEQPRRRYTASLLVLVLGMGILLVALVIAIAGVPGNMQYSAAAAGTPTDPATVSPLEYANVIDENVKYLRDNSGNDPGSYIALEKSISAKEDGLMVIAAGLGELNENVQALDTTIGALSAVTQRMSDEINEMAGLTASANSSMQQLSGSLSSVGGSMSALRSEAEALAQQVETVESEAAAIADDQITEAKSLVEDLNKTLPDDVPTPTLSTGDGE